MHAGLKTKRKILSSWINQVLGGGELQPFSTMTFYAPLTHSLILTRGTGDPTFTRATTAYVEDFEGLLKQVPSGCARFQGARFVRNLLTYTEDFSNAAWLKLNAGTGAVPTVTAGQTDPRGGTKATRVQCSIGSRTVGDYSIVSQSASHPAGSICVYQMWIKSNTGSNQYVTFCDASRVSTGAGLATGILVTPTWQLFSFTGLGTSANPNIQFGCRGPATGGSWYEGGSDTIDILVAFPQIEPTTGQSNQNPSEYVSVGVLSAPYHGAGVDGCKYFNTQNGNTVASNVVTEATGAFINSSNSKFGVLPGVSGSYFSTPDSAANSITGDIDIRFVGTLSDWTPAGLSMLVAKSGGALSYRLGIQAASGKLVLDTGGANAISAVSSVATGFTDGTIGAVRATVDVDNGASGSTTTFYTSVDLGATWTQLGTTVVTAGVAAIADSTEPIEIGSRNGGTASLHALSPRRAQIYNGIGGTLAVDFNPNTFASGTTWTSSTTGEVWTINGTAKVFGGSGTSSITAPWDATGPNGYFAEGARTNLCLQSNALTTTWTATSATPTQNAIGIDGATSAWTLTNPGLAGLASYITQAVATSAATYSLSVYVKKTTGAQSGYPVIEINTSPSHAAFVTIDTSNGVATIWTAYTGFTIRTSSATCVSANANYWRVTLTVEAEAGTADIYFFSAGTTNATQSTGTLAAAVTGTSVWTDAQLEAAAFASSYIPTTTVAVARNAEIDSYASASNITAAASTVLLTFTPTHAPSGTIALWGTYVDASNYTALLHDGTNLIFRKRIAGVNTDATKALAFVAGTTYKIAFSWGAAGQLLYVDGTAGTPHADTASAQVGSTIQIGADGTSLQQPFASIKNDYHWTSQLTAAQHASIST